MAKAPGWIKAFLSVAEKHGADTSEMLGCAHFGCVFAMKKDPKWVVKLTRDPTEAPMWRWINKKQKEGEYGMDAFAFTKKVVNVGKVKWRGKEWPVTLVVREAVDPAEREKDASFLGGDKLLRRSLKGLFNSQVAARRFHELKTRHMKDMNLQAYMNSTGEISTAMPYIGDAMAHLTGLGVVLADVHSGNVGRTVVDWGDDIRGPGTWVIFDPGHTPILDPDEVWA